MLSEKSASRAYTRWEEINLLKRICSNIDKEDAGLKNMTPQIYDTMSEALTGLYNQGFTCDFNLVTRKTYNALNQLPIRDLLIISTIRFENNSDPADNAVLYAIVSDEYKIRGTLVNGYGIYSDALTNNFINSICSQGNHA